MATRHEKVVLDLEDRFSSGMARAAASTALLKRELGGLSGSAVKGVGTDLERTGTAAEGASKKTREYTAEMALADEKAARLRKTLRDQAKATLDAGNEIEKAGAKTEQSGKQIDRLSGRLALLAQAAAVLGPALVPIGAAAIPAVAGLTAEMGAAALSVGVAVAAFKGMGDALKALNAYELAPTGENLMKMRVEMQKLGPDGAHFVRFLNDLTPKLSELQMTARSGLLPGMEDGITHLLTLMPRVNRIVGEVATTMGHLSAEAGDSLSGPRFRDFFAYLDREATPLLDELAHTVGNVADGFASMVVAFGPLSADFSHGLEGMSKSFADWAHGLQDSNGFQSFLDYIEKTGPRVLDLLGSLGNLVVQIVQAAAPVGSVVLPALTQLVNVVADLVDSPLGSTFFSIAAAMSAYSLATKAAIAATEQLGKASLTTAGAMSQRVSGAMTTVKENARQLGAGLGIVALSMTDLDDKAGLSNTAMLALAGTFLGPWGAAAGATIGLTMDLAKANDDLEAAITRADDAARSGHRGDQRDALKGLREEMQAAKHDAQDLSDFLSFKQTDEGYLTNISHVLKGVSNWLHGTGSEADFAKAHLRDAMRQGGSAADLFGETIGRTGRQMDLASQSAKDLSHSLGVLEGFFDKRAASRAYQQSIDDLTKSLKKHSHAWDEDTKLGRDNLDLLDANATAAIEYAKQIKGKGARESFLEDFRKQLVSVKAASPEAAKAVDKILKKLDAVGLTHPKAKVDVDTANADRKTGKTKKDLDDLDHKKSTAHVDVDDKSAKQKQHQADNWIQAWGRKNAAAKVDADTAAARTKVNVVDHDLDGLVARHTTVRVDANVSAARAALAAARAQLNAMDGLTATTYLRTIRTGPGGTSSDRGYASGGYTGQGGKYEPAGIVHRDEIVLPREIVRRDASMLRSRYGFLPGMSDLPGYANGGLVGSSRPFAHSDGVDALNRTAQQLAETQKQQNEHLKHEMESRKKLLENELKRDEHEVERDKKRLDALKQELQTLEDSRRQLMQQVASQFKTDIFGGNLDLMSAAKSGQLPSEVITQALNYAQANGITGTTEEQVQAYFDSLSPDQLQALQAQAGLGQLKTDASNADAFQKAIKKAKKHGLSGGLLHYLEASGNLGAAQQFASMSADQIAAYEKAYKNRNYEVSQTARMVGNDKYAAAIHDQSKAVAHQTRVLEQAKAEAKETNQALHRLEHRMSALEKATKHVGQDTAKALDGVAANSQRRNP